jgi:hydrogenase-4 component H
MILSWLRRGLRTGILTTRYPAVQEKMPDGFRGRPVLDGNRCLAGEGCGACVQVCLPGALSLAEAISGDEHPSTRANELPQVRLDYGRCIMCGLCVSACPAGALRMSEEYELAVEKPEDLCVSAVFERDGLVDETKEQRNGSYK